MAQAHTPHIPSTMGKDMVPRQTPEVPISELVKDALAEGQELVRLEVALAKTEVKETVKELKVSAIAFGVAAVTAIITLSMLLVALVLALGGTPLAALGVAGVLLLVVVAAAALGWSKLPKKPLHKTRRRLETDVRELKEHLA